MVLLIAILGVLFYQPVSSAAEQKESILERIGVKRGICVVLGDAKCELALKLADSKQPALLDTLGWVHYRLGEYDQAAAVLSGVVEQAPEIPVFRYHLGMTYYRQGDTRAAREILSEAVADEYDYAGVDEARRVYAELAGS